MVGGTSWVYCDRTIGIPIADALALTPLPAPTGPTNRASSARQQGKRRDAFAKAERDRREALRHRGREAVMLFGGLLMRTNPRSRHGEGGRQRLLQILQEREEADRARARVAAGLPANFDVCDYMHRLEASLPRDENDEDPDEGNLRDDSDDSDTADANDLELASLVPQTPASLTGGRHA